MKKTEYTLPTKESTEQEKQRKGDFLRTWRVLDPTILETLVVMWRKSHLQGRHEPHAALLTRALRADATSP